MSFCTRPIVAAKSEVTQPTTATTSSARGAIENTALVRAIMYTPAVTIVAAWINALTGVGPSIASGSQTYNGSCADFPVAPTNRSKAIAVSVPFPIAKFPAAIDWLCAAFGFAVRIRVEGEGGRIEHSELTFGESVIMVSQEGGAADPRPWKTRLRSPRAAGGLNTQGLMLYVDDVPAHCARARAHGAQILEEPAVHDYGADYWTDQSYSVLDLEGHLWWMTQRLRDPPRA